MQPDLPDRYKKPDPMRDFKSRYARRRTKGEMPNLEHRLFRASAPPDVLSARAKSQRHGQVTADHWNQ